MKSLLIQILLNTALLLVFEVVSVASISAQTIKDWFEKFPQKRELVSFTDSPTNKVMLDFKNHYLRITTASKSESGIQTTTTIFKMFFNEDGTQHFAYLVADDEGKGNGCVKSTLKIYVVQDDAEWKDVTAILVPSLRLSEFYGKKNVPNLIDVNGTISYTPEQNRNSIGLGLAWELPQMGTSITARLIPRCDTKVLPEYAQLLQECKYKAIDLAWDAVHTWFIISKKLEK